MTNAEQTTGSSSEGRAKRKAIVLLLLLVVVGLTLAVSAVAYRWQVAEKADRLRAGGRPISATVSDFYSGSGRGSGADWVEVTYSVDGRSYRGRVKCGGGTGCVNAPGPEVTIRVDPEDPEEFLLEGGNVTGSLFFLNSWSLIPGGLVVATVGGALITAGLFIDRRARAALLEKQIVRPSTSTTDKRKRRRKGRRL